MNDSTGQHTTPESGTSSSPNSSSQRCVCGGRGPAVSQMLEMMMPPDAVGEHFRNAGVEFLKGFRELLDHQIHTLSQKQSKGTKLNVE